MKDQISSKKKKKEFVNGLAGAYRTRHVGKKKTESISKKTA